MPLRARLRSSPGKKEAELAAAREPRDTPLGHGPPAPILRTHKDVWPGSASRHPRTRGVA